MHIIAIHSSDAVDIVHALPPELQSQIEFVVIDPFGLGVDEVEDLQNNSEPIFELPTFDEDDNGNITIDIDNLIPKELNLEKNIIYSPEYIEILTRELLKYSNEEE